MRTKPILKKKFVEKTCKKHMAGLLGYYYEDEQAKIDDTDGRAVNAEVRNALVANFRKKKIFFGKPVSDILNRDRHLLNGVTLQMSSRRSTNAFCAISESNKHKKVEINDANLYVRNLTAIEKTLLKTSAVCRYTEVLSWIFSATTGKRSWNHEKIFFGRISTTYDICNCNKSSNPWNYSL